MISLASAKAALDLGNGVIGLIKEIAALALSPKARAEKRKLARILEIERSYQSIFEPLKPIAKQYHGAIQSILNRLSDADPNLIEIETALRKDRAEMVIDRNSVIGIVHAYKSLTEMGGKPEDVEAEMHASGTKLPGTPTYEFCESVLRLFYESNSSLISIMSDNISKGRRLLSDGGESQFVIQTLQTQAQDTLNRMEDSWIVLNRVYETARIRNAHTRALLSR